MTSMIKTQPNSPSIEPPTNAYEFVSVPPVDPQIEPNSRIPNIEHIFSNGYRVHQITTSSSKHLSTNKKAHEQESIHILFSTISPLLNFPPFSGSSRREETRAPDNLPLHRFSGPLSTFQLQHQHSIFEWWLKWISQIFTKLKNNSIFPLSFFSAIFLCYNFKTSAFKMLSL